MRAKDLINFEKEIFKEFEKGNIKGVIHLSGSVDGKYEEDLVKLFKKIKKSDWVFSNHRNHYHMLLKAGKRFTRKNIMKGESMHQYSKKYKVFTSGIVGGQIPIALGVALSLKLKKEKGHVYCFVGDMANHMGTFNVCLKYAIGHNLPITFIVEDNEMAVYTPTDEVWGKEDVVIFYQTDSKSKLLKYKYKRKYPHHGIGKFVHF